MTKTFWNLLTKEVGLTVDELRLLDRVTLTAIGNGNTVNPVAYDPTPEEYGLLHDIRIKLGLNEKL